MNERHFPGSMQGSERIDFLTLARQIIPKNTQPKNNGVDDTAAS